MSDTARHLWWAAFHLAAVVVFAAGSVRWHDSVLLCAALAIAITGVGARLGLAIASSRAHNLRVSVTPGEFGVRVSCSCGGLTRKWAPDDEAAGTRIIAHLRAVGALR